jgi:hypothetical protein
VGERVTGKRTLAAVLVVIVALAVTTGIMIIGSPSEERTRRLDARRVEDLQGISQSVEIYRTRHQRFPASLEELAAEPGLSAVQPDPVSGSPYGYRTVDARSYELCGEFDRETADVRAAGFWSHGAGRQCFTLKIKEE